jgi:hypothetical protein
LQIPLKEGIGGESRPKDRVTLWITLLSTFLKILIMNLAFGEHFWVGTLWVRKNLWNSSVLPSEKRIVGVSCSVVPWRW